MIKHIVMWKVKEENKQENIKKMIAQLENLKDKIQEIISIEAGMNFNSGDAAFDIVLYSEFENEETLAKYQSHPAHQEVATFIKSVTENRAVVDYKS